MSGAASYVDLGHYNFVTAPDSTGLNPGNMTSTLSTSNIRLSYFELYRLLLNVSTLPTSGLPQLVQVTSATGSSASSLSLTFGKNTTVGNTVVVVYGAFFTVGTSIASGITLGGSADHFGFVIDGVTSVNQASGQMWVDPDITQASTAVVITTTGGSGSGVTQAYAFEFSGCLATTSPTTATDAANASQSTTATTSLTTPSVTATAANDIQVGYFMDAATSGSGAASGQAGWNNQGALAGPGFTFYSVSGYQIVGKGVSATYGGSGPTGGLVALIGSFFAAAGTGAVTIPYTVAIDGHTWDVNSTTAGVGMTYNLNQPLYLNNGNTIQILWNLPAATYANYSNSFNITGWFRYDPDNQPGELP